MNWNDWEFIWKRQPPPVGASADVAQLAATFEAKRQRMGRALLVRDISESSAGVLVCVFLALFWRRMGPDGWPMGLAIALTLGVIVFFCLERLRAHRGRLGPEAPIAARIARQLAELRRMRRLHYNIIPWYLAPLGVSWALVVFAALRVAARHAPPGYFMDLMRNPATAAFIIGYFVVAVPLWFWGAWFVNRRAVLKQIDPRIEELEKLQRELTPPA
jgi:hypothetical protein